MKTILILISALMFTACSGGGGGSNSASEAPRIVQPGSGDQGNGNPVTDPPEAVSITYYKRSRTDAPINGWINKTYTAVGSCLQYELKTYCWDDGIQTIDFTANQFHYGPYTYNYWNLQRAPNGNYQSCSGGCLNSYMQSPTMITQTLLQAIPQQNITQILSTGTAVQVVCTKQNQVLSCGSFSVNL